MAHKIIDSKKVPKAYGPFSQAILAGNTLYIGGTDPIAKGDKEPTQKGIYEQTKLALKNFMYIVEEAGMKTTDVVQVRIFTTNLKKFCEINKAYVETFGNWEPARFVIEVARLPLPSVHVKIEGIAVKSK